MRLNGDMERPSPTNEHSERVATVEQATRLAALNTRRPPSPVANAASPDVAQATTERDALNNRLEALANRRTPPKRTAPVDASVQSTPGRRTRRRHAARGARAAALALSLASTGGLATLFAVTGGSTAAGDQVAAATIGAGTGSAIVDGAVFHNKWGDVQVEATFAPDGTLLAVTAPQTPSRDSKSVRINDRAVPQLNSEALTAQNADVDTISGATYTSNDYRRSLQSAIDAARAAGLTAIA